MSKMDAAFLALVAFGLLSYFSVWFMIGVCVVTLGIIAYLFAQSLGWVR